MGETTEKKSALPRRERAEKRSGDGEFRS